MDPEGDGTSRITILPNGRIEISNDQRTANVIIEDTGNIQVNTQQNLTATVGGTTMVNSTGDATVTDPNVNITGNVTLTGDLTVNGNLAASGGNFTHNGTNVGATHTHPGVTSGSSSTLGPQ